MERRRRQRAHRRQAIVAALGTREKSGQDLPTQRRSRQAHQAARNHRRRQLRRARRSSQISREVVNSLVRAVTHRSETTAETVQLLTNRDWHSATTVTGENVPGNCDQATKGHPAADWVAVHPQGEPIGSVQRGKDDGVLLIVTARLFGHECRALIDSGATRSFVTPAAVSALRVTQYSSGDAFGVSGRAHFALPGAMSACVGRSVLEELQSGLDCVSTYEEHRCYPRGELVTDDEPSYRLEGTTTHLPGR